MSEMQLRLRAEYDMMNERVGFFETTKNNVFSYGVIENWYELEMEVWG